MSRRKARVLAFQALYCYEAVKPPLDALFRFDWTGELKPEVSTFASHLAAGTIENLDEIDAIIKKHLRNWEISRIKRVDLAILRISIYSLLFQKEIPPPVVIEEACAISRDFGDDASLPFINALLDNVRRGLGVRS